MILVSIFFRDYRALSIFLFSSSSLYIYAYGTVEAFRVLDSLRHCFSPA